jgi:hypothetical protein
MTSTTILLLLLPTVRIILTTVPPPSPSHPFPPWRQAVRWRGLVW